jgi:hypothetical protein
MVASLFGAFLAISRARTSRLLGVAGISPGVGREPNRALLDAISSEVAKSASHLLQMCIRAIDYCPPVDVNCGDYLRALITADADLIGEDQFGYRNAVATAFRQRGIFARNAGGTFPLDLLWPPAAAEIDLSPGLRAAGALPMNRRSEFEHERQACRQLSGAIKDLPAETLNPMGLAMTIRPSPSVDSFRLARRAGPRGSILDDWIITITQQRPEYLDPDHQTAPDTGGTSEGPDFTFRGGCTFIVDARTLQARYCIAKHILDSERLNRYRKSQQRRMSVSSDSEQERKKKKEEPFSLLRRGALEIG